MAREISTKLLWAFIFLVNERFELDRMSCAMIGKQIACPASTMRRSSHVVRLVNRGFNGAVSRACCEKRYGTDIVDILSGALPCASVVYFLIRSLQSDIRALPCLMLEIVRPVKADTLTSAAISSLACAED